MAMEEQSKNVLIRLSRSALRKMLVVWASLLIFVRLNTYFRKLFPHKVWRAEKESTKEGLIKLWSFLFSAPIFILLVIFLEEWLKSRSIEIHTSKEEICPKTLELSTFYCLVTKSELLKLFETFAIITAFLLYVSDRKGRREQAMRENWSLIHSARGSRTSGARFSAITTLHLEKESLRGLDAENSDLRKIDLEGADLENANLQKVDLRGSILVRANLNGVNLSGANLEEADCREVQLWEADLRNANLRKVNFEKAWIGAGKLHRANLSGANLYQSDLRGARFLQTKIRGVDLRESKLRQAAFQDVDFHQVKIEGADIHGTRFIRPLNLDIEQIQSTKNWHEAYFSIDFAPGDSRFKRDEEPKPWQNSSDGDGSAELLRLTDEIHAIESLLEEIRSRKIYSLDELRSRLNVISLELPEISTLREMLLHLEDLSDSKREEINAMIDDLDEQIARAITTENDPEIDFSESFSDTDE